MVSIVTRMSHIIKLSNFNVVENKCSGPFLVEYCPWPFRK